MYKKYDATRVLDFTAGWGARMVAAMALDIDYIGIDSNKSLNNNDEMSQISNEMDDEIPF